MPVSCHNVRQRASGVRAKQCICSKIVAGPKAWNSLPSELICIAVDSTFRHHLEVELFSRAYGVSINI